MVVGISCLGCWFHCYYSISFYFETQQLVICFWFPWKDITRTTRLQHTRQPNQQQHQQQPYHHGKESQDSKWKEKGSNSQTAQIGASSTPQTIGNWGRSGHRVGSEQRLCRLLQHKSRRRNGTCLLSTISTQLLILMLMTIGWLVFCVF